MPLGFGSPYLVSLQSAPNLRNLRRNGGVCITWNIFCDISLLPLLLFSTYQSHISCWSFLALSRTPRLLSINCEQRPCAISFLASPTYKCSSAKSTDSPPFKVLKSTLNDHIQTSYVYSQWRACPTLLQPTNQALREHNFVIT